MLGVMGSGTASSIGGRAPKGPGREGGGPLDFFFFFLKIYLPIRERKSESASESGGGGAERESQANSPPSTAPDPWLDPATRDHVCSGSQEWAAQPTKPPRCPSSLFL